MLGILIAIIIIWRSISLAKIVQTIAIKSSLQLL